MRKFTLFLIALCVFQTISAQTPNHVVISQIYGGGGSTSAGNPSHFKNDFIELYNPAASPVSLAGWSLQYTGDSSAFAYTNKVNLSGTVGAGKYFLIQLDAGSGGAALPTPDFASPVIIMSASSGKVALVSDTALIIGNCASGSNVIDLVGYGKADCREGISIADNAPGHNNATAAFRINNGCVDNDNNKTDFYIQAPLPRNSASAGHTCGTTIAATITPALFCITNSAGAAGTVSYSSNNNLSGTLNVYLSNASGNFYNAQLIGSGAATGNNGSINITIPAGAASGTAYSIRVDATTPEVYGSSSTAFEIINGAKDVAAFKLLPDSGKITVFWLNPTGCFDEIMLVCKEGSAIGATPSGDGSSYNADLNYKGAGTVFDGGKVVYKGSASPQVITGLDWGSNYYVKAFTRNGSNWSSGVEANETIRWTPLPGEIVINQFSPDYKDPGDEYIELVNNTGKEFNLSDLNLSYKSPTGGFKLAEALVGILKPHSYWLLSTKAQITVGKTSNITADDIINDGYGLSGQFAIIRRIDSLHIDALAYGSVTANIYTETTAASAAPNNGGLRRISEGVDSNDNSTDFTTVTDANIDLRNSNSRLANTGAAIAAGNYSRLYVTGNASITGNISLAEKLVLSNGKLSLGNFNLQTAATEGGSTNGYVQTNGSGIFTQNAVGSTPVLLPVGNSTYNPITIQNGSGLNWQVQLEDTVKATDNGASVKRTWNITPSATPASGATITFEYNEGDPSQLGPNFISNDGIQVWHHHNGAWQKAGAVQMPSGTAGGVRTVTLNNWTQFSPFVLSSAAAVLPIRFDALRLQEKGTALLLTFTIQNESNIHHYEIESSTDGIHFTKKALILPRDNNGGTVRYEFTDAMLLAGDRYYRVRATEQDGSISFSGVVKTIAKKATAPMQITPNPVVDRQLNYAIGHLAAGKYTLRVWDAGGRLVKTESLQHAGGFVSGSLHLPALGKGWHLLEFSGPQTLQRQFIAQ